MRFLQVASWFCGGIAAGLRWVKSPSRGRLGRRFEKVRGRHKNSPTGWGVLKNHLVCIVTASSKYRNANRERESLRYRENYMIYFKILQFYLNTMRVFWIKCGTEDIYNYIKFHTPLRTDVCKTTTHLRSTYYGHPTPIRISLKCRPPRGGKLCWNSPYPYFSIKTYLWPIIRTVRQDGSKEGSQLMFLWTNKKNNLWIILNTPSYLELWLILLGFCQSGSSFLK